MAGPDAFGRDRARGCGERCAAAASGNCDVGAGSRRWRVIRSVAGAGLCAFHVSGEIDGRGFDHWFRSAHVEPAFWSARRPVHGRQRGEDHWRTGRPGRHAGPKQCGRRLARHAAGNVHGADEFAGQCAVPESADRVQRDVAGTRSRRRQALRPSERSARLRLPRC